MQKSGLYLSHVSAGPEEVFSSGLVKRSPGVKASDRAYSAALDSIRVQAWDNYTAFVKDNPNVTDETFKAIAELINISTGRGQFPVLDRKMVLDLTGGEATPTGILRRWRAASSTSSRAGSLRRRLSS